MALTFTKLTNPAVLPSQTAYGAAFSPDDLYLALAHNLTPWVTMYKRSGDTFTWVGHPATKPTGLGYGVAFSPDGVYLAVGHNASPYITIYKRSGDVFTKLDNPGTLPTGNGTRPGWSSDGIYLAVPHEASPYITIYKRSGDTFTKLDNPGTLPANNGTGAAFSPDDTYLAVAHTSSPYVTIYKRDGDTFTKLDNPGTLPTGHGRGVAFSADGVHLAVAHWTSPRVTIYKRSGDVFTKLDNPGTLPTGDGEGCGFSPDGAYLAVGHWVTPYVTIYGRAGDAFTKLDNPGTLPTGNGTNANPSRTSHYLAVAHDVSPYITIYRSSDIATAVDAPATVAVGAPIPSVGAGVGPTIVVEVPAALSVATVIPSVTATKSPTILAVAAAVSVVAPVPSATTTRSPTVLALAGAISLAAPSPAAGTIQNPTILAVAAALQAAANLPNRAGITFITPINITPTGSGWKDANLSAYVPAGTAGVMLDVVNVSVGETGWRKNGSTDTHHHQDNGTNWTAFCGVDASRILEVYNDSVWPATYRLIGYFDADSAVFFTNLPEKTPASAGVWCDLDLSSLVGTDDPVAALFDIREDSGKKYGLRCNGSTDEYYQGTGAYVHRGAITALDASHVCEGRRQSTGGHFYVNGYIKSSATFTVNTVLQDVATDSLWHDLAALPTDAIGGFYQLLVDYDYDMRKKGSTLGTFDFAGHAWRAVQCDANRIVEAKLGGATNAIYLMGYASSGFGVFGTSGLVVLPPVATCQIAAPIPTVQTTAECLTAVLSPARVYLAAAIPDPVIERNAEAVSPVATLAVGMAEPITITSGNVTEFLWPATLHVALPIPTLFAGIAPAIEPPAAALALAGPAPTVTAARNVLTESRTSTILVSAPVPSAECVQEVTLEAPTADLSLVAQVPPAVTTGAWSLIQAPLAALVTAALEVIVTTFRLPLPRTLQQATRLKILSQRSEAVLSPLASTVRFRTLPSEVVFVR